MARCGCSGQTCSCKVVAGSGPISVTGSGSGSNPYTVNVERAFEVNDTASVDLTLTGTGATADPYVLSADATIALDDITDVDTSGASTGDVLALQSGGGFALNPPSTASPGAVVTGNGIEGDGSGGDPLTITLAPNSGLSLSASGLAATTNLVPEPVVVTVSADRLLTAMDSGGTASRISGATTSFTNPSASGTLLVKCVQEGALRVYYGGQTLRLQASMNIEVVGGTTYVNHLARYRSPVIEAEYYDDYESYSLIKLDPSASVTVYARAWTYSGYGSLNLSKATPTLIGTTVQIVPLAWLDV